MKAPGFWYHENSLAAALLSPVAAVYELAGRIDRSRVRPAKAGAPVICIGNLVAGGAGKTPTALAVADLLSDRSVAFLSRGYGGRLAGPVRVAPDFHSAADVGDEALLLARRAVTWVARDRPAGAAAAVANGAAAIVMDDGFQNPSLVKDLSILVVDGETGFGNGHLIPAGPLREPIDAGMARADAVVLVGDDAAGARGRVPAGTPVFTARIVPTARDLSGARVVAFAGIARPEKFFATLEAIGCDVVARHALADHHLFAASELARLRADAEGAGARLVTTEKDAVRLPPDMRDEAATLPVALAWDDRDAAAAFVRGRLG
jgi:tetraacyldisaccharide 4'-kinase